MGFSGSAASTCTATTCRTTTCTATTTTSAGSATILTQTIPEGLTIPGEDVDSPGFSRLLNESMFEIFSQLGMSDLLTTEKQKLKRREEGKPVDTTQGTL